MKNNKNFNDFCASLRVDLKQNKACPAVLVLIEIRLTDNQTYLDLTNQNWPNRFIQVEYVASFSHVPKLKKVL